MATEKEGLGKFFYEPDEASQITGVQQKTALPKVVGNLQLGSGLNAPMLDVATPCMFSPVVLVVTSLPAMYTVDGKVTKMGYVIKELIESHAKSVSGIDFSYSMDTQEAPTGHDGQQMASPGKTKRSAVSPSFVFAELSGNIVWDTFRKWMWDCNHPDTNAGMANVVYPGAWTMSAYSMSMMAIQFDPTMRPDHIITAAHYVNMFPTSIGDLGLKRDIGTYSHPERTIQFTGMVQHNEYIKTLAMAIAEKLALHKHNYNIAPPTHSTIEKNITGLGQDQMGLEGEHRTRQEWAEQAGIDALNTNGAENNDITHRIDPTKVGGDPQPFTRTEKNWNED